MRRFCALKLHGNVMYNANMPAEMARRLIECLPFLQSLEERVEIALKECGSKPSPVLQVVAIAVAPKTVPVSGCQLSRHSVGYSLVVLAHPTHHRRKHLQRLPVSQWFAVA